FRVIAKPIYTATLYDLLKAYGSHAGRRHAGALHILPMDLYSMDDALKRIGGMIGQVLDWTSLASFLPEGLVDGLGRRSAIAATFCASVEMVRAGRARIRQDSTFGPIYIKSHEEGAPS